MKLQDRASPPATLPATRPGRQATRGFDRRSLELTAVVLLLLVGTFLRTARISDVQYRYDDDALWNIVMRMVRSGHIAEAGLTSTISLPNGPFQAYLLAPFGWLGGLVPFMTLGVAFLNILALAIVYRFGRDFFGPRVGLIALLLATVSPWQTVLSRRLLGNDMVAPFAALSLWMLARWLFRRDGRAAPIAGAALAVAGQVYVIGLECLAPAALTVLLAGRRLLSRSLLLGVLVFVALMAPYVWTQALPRAAGLTVIHDQTIQSVKPDFSAIGFALQMASNDGYQAFATQAGGHLDATSGVPDALGLLARLLYLLGLGIGVWTLIRGPGRLGEERRGVHLLLLTAFVAPVVVLFRPTVPVRLLYLVATFPLPYLYGAIALDRLWLLGGRGTRVVRRLSRGAVLTFLGATTILDLALGGIFLSVTGQYWSHSDYGIPWALNDQSARTSSQLAQHYGAGRILVLDDASDFNMLEWVLAERRGEVADFDDTRLLVLPGQPTLYVAPGDQPAQRTLAALYHQYLVGEVQWPGDGTTIRYYLLPPSTASAALPPMTTPLNWTAGGLVRFDGVAAPHRLAAGQTVTVQLTMTVLKPPPTAAPDFSVFVHLLDASGNAVAKQDQNAFPTHAWLAGDRIIQTFTLTIPPDVPPGVLSLGIGMYSTDLHGTAIRPLALTDAQGASLGPTGSLPIAAIAPSHAAQATHPLSVQFAQGIALDGYDVSQSGNVLTVSPHWTASAAVAQRYTTFVHVLDAAGHLVAQSDAPPLEGRFPTNYWQAGDVIPDSHAIKLPANLASGTYHLEFGLYDSKTLVRLPVLSGQPVADVTIPAGRSA
jgi:4-amino-4-deoxy-L-arabinose transferase-like glycosyltransferase